MLGFVSEGGEAIKRPMIVPVHAGASNAISSEIGNKRLSFFHPT